MPPNGVPPAQATEQPHPDRQELLGALTLAIDLGLGLPAEHVLRSAICAHRLAGALGLDAEQQRSAFHTTVMMWIGCHADSFEYSRWFGDDIAARRASYRYDWAGLSYAQFLAGNAGRGRPAAQRAATFVALARAPRAAIVPLVGSHCTSAAIFARRLGLGDQVADALGFVYERWDGRGGPAGARRTDLPITIRIAQVADVAQARHEVEGVEAAVELVRSRAGGQLDPEVVAALIRAPDQFLTGEADVWSQVADIGVPSPGPSVDEVVECLGQFADVKSPWTLGHSAGVAGLVAAAARHAGASRTEHELLRRAGHLHDLGRLGVSNLVWDKAGQLTSPENERMRMHPYLTARVLRRVGSLNEEARIAANHHERLDGTGYPNGLSGSSLGLSDQLLAAADAFHTAIEPRPHRPAATRTAAATALRREVAAGRLSGDAAAAVLEAAGETRTVRRAWPDGLTAREVDVLRLVARARTTAQIGTELGISTKTVRNHIDHVFEKTGTNNRVGASLYAVHHGLVDP